MSILNRPRRQRLSLGQLLDMSTCGGLALILSIASLHSCNRDCNRSINTSNTRVHLDRNSS